MADRVDFYFRQRVTEAELDLAFSLLEKADRNLAADLRIYGIVAGAVPSPHTPVADLSIDLTAPARAYDNLGQRIFFGTGQTVSCAVDLVGIPTDVATAGHERWLGVFLRFKRLLSDPRTDGNSQQVMFRRDESFELVVRQAPEGVIGAAPKAALQADELLVCDVRRRPGQTQVLASDIDQSRRQAFIFAQAGALGVISGAWNILAPALETVQATFDDVDAKLREHFTAAARRHNAAAIDYAPHGFLAGANLQAALNELVDDLSSGTVGASGGTRVAVDAAPGAPNALPAGSVKSQLVGLLGFLNAHVGASSSAHKATAIAALPFSHVTSTNVQAQLQEIVSDLESTSPTKGTAEVGSGAIAGAPYSLATGTARSQLASLLASLNTHVGGGDHDGRYWKRTDKVNDADTVDGVHASQFASAGHDHDGRYMRRVFLQSDTYNPSQQRLLVTLPDRPDLVTVSYNYLTSGIPQATTYVRGAHTEFIRAWVTKKSVGGGDKDYEVYVQNTASIPLYVNVAAYRVGT
jgi:hypothetical protein